VPSPALSQRDMLQDFQSAASRILDAAATKASDAVDHVQSAVSSAATALPQLEDHVPLNCSFGIIRFCIGFRHSLSCSGWPFTLSALLPDELQDLPGPLGNTLQAAIQELSPLPGSWWCQRDQIRTYPRLSRMAFDILSVPPGSADPESAFSGARRTVSWDRERMSCANLEKVECIGNWLREGLIILSSRGGRGLVVDSDINSSTRVDSDDDLDSK
jgi:hypothetical protein